MRITCVGGGPAGLYFATLAKLADPKNEVTVLERNPAGVTWGWGVVFWDDLLDDLFAYDPVSAGRIWDAAYKWDEYAVRATGKPDTHLAGYGFSLGRHRLLEILAERAVELGVDIRYSDELADLSDLPPSDLIVACDGARSRIREAHAEHFGAEVEVARNRYIWLGTPKVFDTFTFGFEETEAGWIWFHAYPFDSRTSTFIVECTPETWAGLSFDEMDARAGTARLAEIFAKHLDGADLIDHRAEVGGTGWLNFRRVTAQRWDHGNIVLMGDSAHTTHFAIGSGTKLAMQDAMALADAVASGDDLPVALERYEHRRKAALAPLQKAARASSAWFERMPEYANLPAKRFSYALSNRRGEYPTWRYLLHMATQSTVPRTLLRWTLSARRSSRARRRPTTTHPVAAGQAIPNTA
ncbi:2-polyprenyl-6-methoxyphenol hydroxylase-like FAD-dependent oxidoreductase [Actinoplanes campanulatus]|uniref:2-polyprenyl-6-methoxyphenol hydroxylase-like FAD-dependent oxidoreductase n=1 Tax=Actinoplanes campanulatus TaxID=113559 RepID=A0A7W5AG17_9ACTN|nr:FAD-dependent monooxygenase [Actinoplanes campanulatus]MBB3095129.1 2-polyprenyl-6-methoxyphenol hydroxylase-like FAD-dependent oxidoreductase [Actinoplanes campanulatus]GGN23683.1 FAD-binding monooxygenase [Actinoplanes campanulatus]GID34733.1 FAD-binding monooxygenase [Actinoplanes campanulatus]